MKIALIDISGIGGIGHYVFSLAKALKKNNADFVLITPKCTDFDLDSEKIPAKYIIIPHHRYNSPLKKSVFYLISRIRLLFYLLLRKPDIVHFHEIKLPVIDFFLFRVLKLRDIKIILTLHHLKLFDFNISTRSFSKLYGIADGLILHSQANKDLLYDEYKLKDKTKTAVIPHGEYSTLYISKGSKKEAREKFNLGLDENIILFFGYIRKYKGLDILLEAFNIVLKKDTNFRLIVAGNPKEDMDFYYRICSKYNISNKVMFFPRYIEMIEVPDFFNACDCVVLPYRDIFQSGIAYLSYAYSKPVIASEVGGLPEIIEHENTGLLVPKENREKLADAILEIFKDKKRLSKMGEYAKKYADEKFSWDKISKETINFYDKILTL